MSQDIQAQDANFAAGFNPDVDQQTVGDVYADALFGVIDHDLAVARELLDELEACLVEVWDAFPDFGRLLSSPLVNADEKIAIIERVFGGRLQPVLFDFLRVVAKHGRLDCLRAIYVQARKRLEQLSGRVPVTITTAAALEPGEVESLVQRLGAVWKGELVVTCQVDPEQIGGLVVRVGDTIYDGSIATQLEHIRRNIVNNYTPRP